MAAFVVDDLLSEFSELLNSPLFSKRELHGGKITRNGKSVKVGGIVDALKDAVTLQQATGDESRLVKVLNHINRQVRARRMTQDVGPIGYKPYGHGSTGAEGDRNASLRNEKYRFNEMMQTKYDKNIRGLTTLSEERMRDPGEDTGVSQDFAYLREQEAREKEAQERIDNEHRKKKAAYNGFMHEHGLVEDLASYRRGKSDRVYKRDTKTGTLIGDLQKSMHMDEAGIAKQALLDEKILSIKDPEAFRKLQIRQAWGDADAEKIFKAEDDKKEAEDAKAFADFVEKRIKKREEQEGSYKDDLADATGGASWRREKLTRHLAERYGGGDVGRSRADRVMFARNHKALYKISTWLPKTTNGLMSVGQHFDKVTDFRKNLGLGSNWKVGMALGGTAIGLINKVLATADTANSKVVSYENAAKTYGTGSKRFRYAAGLAGITDPSKQMSLHGKLTEQFGDAEEGIAALGEMLPGLSQKERMFFAKSLGLSPDELAMIDIYNNTGKFKMSNARMTNAKLGLAELSKTYMASSDNDTSDQILATFGSASWAARDISNSTFADFMTTAQKVNDAANSADYFEKNGKMSGNNTGNQVSQHFGDVHLHGVNNPSELASALTAEGGVAGQALQNTNTSIAL